VSKKCVYSDKEILRGETTEDLGTDGRMISECTFGKYGGKM
jgi:hypothetical protein